MENGKDKTNNWSFGIIYQTSHLALTLRYTNYSTLVCGIQTYITLSSQNQHQFINKYVIDDEKTVTNILQISHLI